MGCRVEMAEMDGADDGGYDDEDFGAETGDFSWIMSDVTPSYHSPGNKPTNFPLPLEQASMSR